VCVLLVLSGIGVWQNLLTCSWIDDPELLAINWRMHFLASRRVYDTEFATTRTLEGVLWKDFAHWS